MITNNKVIKLKKQLKSQINRVKNSLAKINPAPIIILGNQKSGTSAIGALLGEATALKTTIDLKGINEPIQTNIHKGKLTFREFINNNRVDFSNDIIKEPSLTLLHRDLFNYFPESQYVFIIREPKQNIRSILNRLNIRGDLDCLGKEENKKLQAAPLAWERIVDGSWLGFEGSYIEMLAHRWVHFVEIYEKYNQKMILVKYEQFNSNKVSSINKLADNLGLAAVNDIGNKVNFQYQPKGNSDVNLIDFFGEKNFKVIDNICGEKMKEYGYH